MVRKQLHITDAQEVALKERARLLGTSEAEVVRAALEEVFGRPPALTPRQRVALDRFVATASQQRGKVPPVGKRSYDRTKLYLERYRTAPRL